MIENKYDFMFLFDVENGNPNGDPDAGNLPRIDPQTGFGLVSDVCIKRKIRNYVTTVAGKEVFMKSNSVLNTRMGEEISKSSKNTKDVEENKKAMCERFWDVRAFGAVMSTGEKDALKAGTVRGPVQIGISSSVDKIFNIDMCVTRCCVTSEKEAKSREVNATMGRKSVVPYALYCGKGFVNPYLADNTGFGEEDLALLWQSITKMFEIDRSAARGIMTNRKLLIFKHNSKLGNANSSDLFNLVRVTKKVDVPRKYGDYEVIVDSVPNDINLIIL